MTDETPLDLLSSRYEDDEGVAPASTPPPAPGPDEEYDEEYDEEEGDDYEDEDDIADHLGWLDVASSGSFPTALGRRPNAQGGTTSGGTGTKFQPLEKRAAGKVHTATKDRSDRATVEQALDPRTRMVLFKMLNRGLFTEIHGCVSTGKEANVYHAVGAEGKDMAVKVFKTSILVFRDRDRYVTGDWRFRRGYCKSNPRKMVKLWAEKETRNLIRLATAGIPCPTPIQLRLHILVMSFIGHDGHAAPRLKDANLSKSKCREVYRELVIHMRTMYQKCKLVHGDLSEYNLLYHEGKVWIIDVSQSVDLDHPHAFDFLREDCLHVNTFFEKNGTKIIPRRELFDFITDPAVKDDQVEAYLDDLQRKIEAAPPMTEQEKVDQEVFHRAFIPRKMDEIADFERDLKKMQGATKEKPNDKSGAARKVDGIYYQTILGMEEDLSGPRTKWNPKASPDQGDSDGGVTKASAKAEPMESVKGKGGGGERGPGGAERAEIPEGSTGRSDSDGASADEGASDGEGGSDSGSSEWEERTKMTREEKKKLRKENKAKVKEENKEKRKHKIPKHIKKKKTKSKGKKK